MKIPRVLQFIIQGDAKGFTAQAVGFPIFTEGNTLDETVSNIKEAVDCHFEAVSEQEVPPIMVNFEVPVFL